MRLRELAKALPEHAAALIIILLAVGMGGDVLARWLGVPLTGGALIAAWLLVWLAMATACSALPPARGPRGVVAWALAGFAIATLLWGLGDAAGRIGGVEPVLGWPVAWRFAGAAVCVAIALCGAAGRSIRGVLAMAVGAALGFLLPPAPPLVGVLVFGVALTARVPVSLALVAAVAVAPGPLNDAALAQTVLRGLGPAVLLAVPLFILAAALLVAGGVGDGLVSVAAWLSRQRRTAAAETNVLTSLLFGGVSGSGIADAALGARLLVPPMIRAGHSPADAAALTASAAIVPNLMPPSIALLLAAAATDQSVGRLWMAGIGAAVVVGGSLWLAVRLRPPPAGEGSVAARPDLAALVPPIALVVAIVGGLRGGLVTATEAGLVAVVLGALYAGRRGGVAALWRSAREAGAQAGRVCLLIGAAAPVSFLVATSGISWTALLPAGAAPLVLVSATLLALAAGTVLDVGAAILLLLPLILPAVTMAGNDPVHATLVLVTALLVGGLTPPVGILVITVKEITGATGVFAATVPYLLSLAFALALLIAWPWLTSGIASL